MPITIDELQTQVNSPSSRSGRYFGKYRGQVQNNLDPMMQGRVQVSCAAVLGDGQMSWAMPCSPYGGSGVGFFMIPPVGANVWVEFEGGTSTIPSGAVASGESGKPPRALPSRK